MITSTLAIRPVRNRYLSLWQSAAEETVRNELIQHELVPTTESVLAHPLMQAAVLHVNCDAKNLAIAEPNIGDVYSPAISRLHFLIAEAKRTNDVTALTALQSECRKYATCDTLGWITCETTYLKYLALYERPIYYDWQEQLLEGQPDIDFGVIGYKLPNDAKVAIIGDWGTGMADANALLAQIIREHKPAAIIHLGDIYYAGTPDQCDINFTGVFNQVFGNFPRIPIFSIPGNHEYYAMGAGYYRMLQQINPLAQPG
ncbi:MAG TPA: metallophosphoesterase, partial [Anaerolineales bacterium]|nr:metallophosphoesterase [Anaerolineales bacterium]